MMRNGYNQSDIITYNESNVVRKAGQVHSAPTALPKSPKQGMLNNGRAGIFNFVTESNSKSGHFSFIISNHTLGLSLGLRDELKNKIHLSGAISRSLRKTSEAGTDFVCPES